MSLNNTDLQAISALIEKQNDHIAHITASGFAEVHGRIDTLQNNMEFMGGQHQQMNDALVRIELRQNAEVDRADQHSLSIARLNRELGLQ